MNGPSPARIVECHEIVDAMMRGEVDPRCQAAQRAVRIATRHPRPSQESRRTLVSPVSRESTSHPERTRRGRRGFDANDPIVQLMFGDLAPQAERALNFFSTPVGRKLGVGATVAFGSALLVG